MILTPAPLQYDVRDQNDMRDALRRAYRESLKRGQDIELVTARLILTSPSGNQFVVTVADDGTLGTAAV